MFFVGLGAMVGLFVLLGFRSARSVGSSSDYSVAGRSAGATGVSGIIMGAIVGGASTIGTVQMAYVSGLSAWWFTLGAALGCLVLGIWFAGPLRRSGLVTVPEFLSKNYGGAMSGLSMVSASAGTFLSVVAQFLAGAALFRTVLPISPEISALLLGSLILAFTYSGGLKSYSSIGKAKMVALYGTMALCAAMAWSTASPVELFRALPVDPWFNPFGGSLVTDGNALLSMVAGVFCTQIYVQGVFAASDERTAVRGAILSAILIPPVGLMGVLIGLAMRASGVSVDPASALPHFIMSNFNPVLSGAMWGTMLITLIGAGAGLSFGIATNLVRDGLIPLMKGDRERDLTMSRWAVALVVASAGIMACAVQGSQILHWSYLSMGLRGAGTFIPLVVAVIWPERLSPRWALAANGAGLAAMAASGSFHVWLPPMASGIAASATITMLGMIRR
ncbi:MAG: sodium:solute symporter family protein [Synergistales bacterium]|nr:sodium:solute symporter family protein [Synergistales bacterium]